MELENKFCVTVVEKDISYVQLSIVELTDRLRHKIDDDNVSLASVAAGGGGGGDE